MTPLVSIIIPTFDRPRYLQEAIESGLAQTYSNIEVVTILILEYDIPKYDGDLGDPNLLVPLSLAIRRRKTGISIRLSDRKRADTGSQKILFSP